jgi:hypothetical protein
MKLGYTLAAVVLATAVAGAQDTKEKIKTKVEVEDGKTITVTGCVGRGAEGGFTLTNVAGKDGPLGSYALWRRRRRRGRSRRPPRRDQGQGRGS